MAFTITFLCAIAVAPLLALNTNYCAPRPIELQKPAQVENAPTVHLKVSTTQDSAEILADSDGFISCTGAKSDFGFLMQQIWVIMSSYAAAVPQDEHSLVWRKWLEQGLTLGSDFQQFKKITDINSLDKFYLFLRDCSPVTTVLDLKWDNRILFRVALPNTPTHDDCSSITTLNKEPAQNLDSNNLVTPSTPGKPTAVDGYPAVINTEPNLLIPSSPTQPISTKLTPKSGNIVTKESSTSAFLSTQARTGDVEVLDSFTLDSTDIDTSYRFIVFHAAVFDHIQAWTESDSAQKHPFRHKWCSWVYRGLDRYRDFSAIRRILGFKTLAEYLSAMQECPTLPSAIHWLWQGDTLHYMFVGDLPGQDKLDPNKLSNMRIEFDMLQTQLTVALKDFNNRIIDMNVRMDAGDHRLSRQSKTIDQAVQNAIQEGKRQISDAFSSQLASFNLQLKTAAQGAILAFKEDVRAELTRVDMTSSNAVIRLQEQIARISESATDKAQSDLFVTLDQLTDSLNAQAHELIATIKATHPAGAEVQQKSNCTKWRGIDIDTTPFTKADKSEPGLATTRSDSQSIKTFTYMGAEENGDLPPLQYDYVLKRVHVTFTGIEDIMVFYNQLLNGCAPYGLYLNKLADVRTTLSVCPKEINGVTLTQSRYDLMAGCLYQKLAQPDTVPLEFTFARNTVNRYAEANDGYAVLLDLLASILQQEDINSAPQSRDWADIYEYALKVQSYFNCELLAGRLHTQKEQCKIFLNGLDAEYKPAVRRARQLLDTGNKSDPQVPDPLKLAVLPTTLTRYLAEETGHATIRAMHVSKGKKPYGSEHDDRGDKPRQNRYRDDHEGSHRGDKPCSICGYSNHHKSQCNAFAKFLVLRAAENKIDDKQREKIIEAYRANIKKKAGLRNKRHQLGTVREMWNMGCTFEEVEHRLMEVMPHLIDGEDSSSDESGSE